MASYDLSVERCRNVFYASWPQNHKPAFCIWWSNKDVMTWFTAGARGDCVGLVRDTAVGYLMGILRDSQEQF